MNRASKSFLDATIIELSKLMIDLSEFIPPLSAEGINKCGEIEGWIIANIFIARVVCSLNVKINDPLVNVFELL